ncbi:hypothetical protein [Afipia sp. GAS231]|jgi:hypothetical protein|uniref:hypothetical protein n=1 Tax=Afipia sp. GAS231 TaxID=1882747 RepID=UPI00087BFDB3|nr:hypothetical protein [Afipia sp. GAS231]SDO77604.1 hypothetical protein SAMN05444050_4978 [Afipia sp. GAS231]
MKHFERFLVDLDSGASGAVSRVALGLCIPPLFRALSGGADRIWIDLALFLALLIGLRVGPAVLRKALPFSAEAKQIWLDRRQIAKKYDCYQWQKLFWVGLGLLPYAAVSGGLRTGEWLLTAICLMGGGAGLLIWRKINAAPPAPQLKAQVLAKTSAG